MYFQLISDVTSPVCRSAAAAISALSLFHREREKKNGQIQISLLSLSNGNANVHPSGSSGQWGRACVRRSRGREKERLLYRKR